MDIIGVERGRMELLKGELDILHHFLNFQPFVSIEVFGISRCRLRTFSVQDKSVSNFVFERFLRNMHVLAQT